MTTREIRLFGDPCLKSVSDEVKVFDRRIQSLIADLLDTTSLPGRAGVAAPQIGVNLRAFSYRVDGQLGYLINPEILERHGELKPIEEGCLSLPELWSHTPRFEKVRVGGVNLDGNQVEFSAEGLLAQVMQHEIDHLDGLLYIDRLDPGERKVAMAKLREQSWFLRS